jgi:hypothetical protein
MVEVRIDDITCVRGELSECTKRGVTFWCRSLIVKGVEDELHERVELNEEVFSSDTRKFSESCHDTRSDCGRGIARFGEKDVEHGDDVRSRKTLGSSDE